MAKVTIDYTLPTTRVDGKPLAVTDIAYVEVFMSADQGANYASVAQVPSNLTEFVQDGLESGEYLFKLVVVDTQNPAKHSAEADTQAVVAASDPSPVTDISVTIA